MAQGNGLAETLAFDYGGRRYLLPARPDFSLELAFQRVHEQWALRRLALHQESMPAEDYRADRDGLRRDIVSNQFAWGGKLFWNFVGTRGGLKELVLLAMRWGAQHGGEQPSPELLDRVAEDPAKWAELDSLVADHWFPFPQTASPRVSTPDSSASSPAAPTSGTRPAPSPVPAGG